jgi:ATP-binding cassette subfamily F protein 3
LIKTVADSLWLVAGGKLEVFDGDLDDYQQSSRMRSQTAPAAPIKETPKRAPRAAAKGGSKPRGRLGGLRREIEQIEQRIAAIAEQRTLVEAELCKNPMHVGLQAQHAELTRDAAGLETRWMDVGTAIEVALATTQHPD